MLQEKLYNLETKLQSLKEEFTTNAIFDEDTLTALQLDKRQRHNDSTEFLVYGVYELPTLLRDKFLEGFTYRPDIHNCYAHPVSGQVMVRLVRPEDILDEENIQLNREVYDLYLANIEAEKERLISEIASKQLEIKDLRKAMTAQVKHENDLAKEVAAVEKEMLSTPELPQVVASE